MPLPARISRNLPQPQRREREGMSKSHLANIRDLPCCVSGSVVGVVAHHLLRSGEHGTGRKSSDRWAIPLASTVHDALHADGDETRFLAERGVDGGALAQELWRNKDNIEAMLRAVLRCLQQARLKRA